MLNQIFNMALERLILLPQMWSNQWQSSSSAGQIKGHFWDHQIEESHQCFWYGRTLDLHNIVFFLGISFKISLILLVTVKSSTPSKVSQFSGNRFYVEACHCFPYCFASLNLVYIDLATHLWRAQSKISDSEDQTRCVISIVWRTTNWGIEPPWVWHIFSHFY